MIQLLWLNNQLCVLIVATVLGKQTIVATVYGKQSVMCADCTCIR